MEEKIKEILSEVSGVPLTELGEDTRLVADLGMSSFDLADTVVSVEEAYGVLADPLGSTIGGGEHADYDIEGIGNDFIPETMDISLVDQVIKVSDAEAFAEVKELAAKEGLIVGTSSGAAVAAARKLIEDGARGNIVTLLPDRGERYFSKHLYD